MKRNRISPNRSPGSALALGERRRHGGVAGAALRWCRGCGQRHLDSVHKSKVPAEKQTGKAAESKLRMEERGKSLNGQRISWANRSCPKSPARCGG